MPEKLTPADNPVAELVTNLAAEISAAHRRIAPFIRETRLQHSRIYSEMTGANVYFKCENLQQTGSFKLRGATNKYLSLTAGSGRAGDYRSRNLPSTGAG